MYHTPKAYLHIFHQQKVKKMSIGHPTATQQLLPFSPACKKKNTALRAPSLRHVGFPIHIGEGHFQMIKAVNTSVLLGFLWPAGCLVKHNLRLNKQPKKDGYKMV